MRWLNAYNSKFRCYVSQAEMSVTELSERVGITMSNISILKNGKQGHSIFYIRKICEALDCQPGDILNTQKRKIKFDASQAEEISRQIVSLESWQKLPLSENVHLIIYGGERTMWSMHIILQRNLEFLMLKTVIGFSDRHNKSTSPEKDVDLFERRSFNFTLAIYDIDTNTLYYFELDT